MYVHKVSCLLYLLHTTICKHSYSIYTYVYMHACIHTYVCAQYVCYVHTSTHICPWMSAYEHVYIYASVHTHVYAICLHTYLHVYNPIAYIYVCVYIYIYIYIYIYTYPYIYIHACIHVTFRLCCITILTLQYHNITEV